MARIPPPGDRKDLKARRSKKRGAGNDSNGPKPSAKSRPTIWNPFASSAPLYDPERDVGSPTPSPEPPTAEERAEQQRRTANLVDAASAAAEIRRIVQTAVAENDPFDPDIEEIDQAWVEKREEIAKMFRSEEAKIMSVVRSLGIKEHSFEELQLIPRLQQDLILSMQQENTVLYKEAFGAEGRFRNTNDNLVTKLTMLHFGLPIEPITKKNVDSCGRDDDDAENDEDEDEDESVTPWAQRILWSEKPLEFLDCYHERSFGLPMLRRPKPKTQNIYRPTEPTPGQLEHIRAQHGSASLQDYARAPVQPIGAPLHLRGGSGDTSCRYLHSRYGASIRLKAPDDQVPPDEFRKAALKALDLHPESDWIIVVDQFENSERYKKTLTKPFVRSFIISKADFDKTYESYVRTRISDPHENYVFSVDYYHLRPNGERFSGSFSIPPRGPRDSDVLSLARLPKVRPPKHKDATHLPSETPFSGASAQTKGELIGKVFAYPSGSSLQFQDSAKAFTDSIKELLPGRERSVTVSFYSKDLDNSVNESESSLDHSITFPLKANLRQYITIQKRLFQQTGWSAVVHETIVQPPSYWPPRSNTSSVSHAKAPPLHRMTRDIATVYRHKEGRETKATSTSFGNRALRLLGLDIHTDWEFAADLYTKQSGSINDTSRALDYSHTIHVTRPSLDKKFEEDIKPSMFSGEADWIVVVRHPDETPAPSFTSFDALPFKPSPTFPLPNMRHHFRPTAGQVKQQPEPKSDPKSDIFAATPSSAISTDTAYIYGYGGKIKVEKNVHSFQTGARQLLGIPRAGHGWSFTVDLHHTSPPTSMDVSLETVSEIFENHIRNVAGNSEYPWPVFVRKCNKTSTKDLTPPKSVSNYVILRGEDRDSYWKLPAPRDGRYGINQVQEGFLSAMLVHYPLGVTRPAEDVTLLNMHLGFGGLEVTEKFYDAVNRQIDSYSADSFIVCDGLPSPSRTALTSEVGIRLAGTERYSTFQRGDFAALARAVRELSRSVLLDHDDPDKPALSLPDQFRVWISPAWREENNGSRLFNYAHSSDTVGALESWVQSEDVTKSASCLWFRPEWKHFTVTEQITAAPADMDLDNLYGLTFQWNATNGATLESFRAAFASLSDGDDDEFTDNFEIIVAKRNQRFVVNSYTTEDEWRKHIFDYFHNNELTVIRNDGIVCKPDSSDPWGIYDMPVTQSPIHFLPRASPKATKYASSRVHIVPERLDNQSDHDDNQPYYDTSDGVDGSLPVPQPPYKARRIPGAKPPTFKTSEVPKFDAWMLDHTAKTKLQQRSWTQDQSVIEPGFAPAAPLYGDGLEQAITVGPSMPTVFIQHLTPTDIMQLRKENRKLLNHVLEREIGCPLCSETFKAYDNDAKVAHYKSHMDVLYSVGQCPMCEEDWALFTIAQKRQHLITDFTKRESDDIKNFWEDVRCPICDLDLKGSSAEYITTHIASHVTGALKFCDRCGLELLACTAAEKAHHGRVCTRKAPMREGGASDPIMCQNCGQERTAASEKCKQHKSCGNGYFCIRCGLNLALLGSQDQQAHFRRCRAPNGGVGKYCKRCGRCLANLSASELASHENECYRKEPPKPAAEVHDLAQAVEEQRLRNAADRADIIHRQEELRAKEQAVWTREQKLRNQQGNRRASNFSRDQYHGIAGAGVSPNTHSQGSSWGICPLPGCGRSFGASTSHETVGAHLRWHANDLADNGRITEIQDMGLCPIPGCGFKLGTKSRKAVRDHLQTHSGFVPPNIALQSKSTAVTASGPDCQNNSLNATLTEFKRRLPDFREAHATLQKLAGGVADAGAELGWAESQIRPSPLRIKEQWQTVEQERAAIFKATSLLGVKEAKEKGTMKAADQHIRLLRSNAIAARSELDDLEAVYLDDDESDIPDVISEARTKVEETDQILVEAEKIEERRRAEATVALGQAAAELAARKKAVGFDTAGDVQTGGNITIPAGPLTASTIDANQAGIVPSPPQLEVKKLPAASRRTRSASRQAPVTSSKRKKVVVDEGSTTLGTAESKREAKKQKLGLRSKDPGTSSPATAPRRSGRPRKVVVENPPEDDSLEDDEEND